MPITIEQAQGLISEFCRIYSVALQLRYKIRATQEEAIHETATIERAGRIFGAYFPVGRYAAFAVSNFRDAMAFTRTLRHEIIGHFGLNTFRPSEKRALIGAISTTRHQSTLSEWWLDVDRRYPSLPESFKAEEIFCLACESIRPDSAVDSLKADQVSRQVILARSRPMEHDDLFTIAVAVADGFKNRTRFQQTFPATDLDQWSREGL